MISFLYPSLLGGCLFSSANLDLPATVANDPDLIEVTERILARTNDFRKKNKRGDLKVDPMLAKTAQDFADFMARTDKYGHTADGKQPWERATAHGYDYCIILENIAYQFSSRGFSTGELTEGFVTGWEKSPPHRENLLDPDVFAIGIGVARSEKSGKYYAVQDFGRPKSMEIIFNVSNEMKDKVTYTLDGKDYSIQPRHTITHQVCRPSKLRLPLPDKGEAKAPSEANVVYPENGSRYVFRRGGNGRVTLIKK